MLFEEIIGAFTGQNRRNRQRQVTIATILGVLGGAAAGILFAPKSGAETRQDIAEASVKGARAVRDASVSAAGKVRDVSSTTVDKLRETAADVGDEMSRQMHRFRNRAAEVARDAADALEEDEAAREAREVGRRLRRQARNVGEDVADTASEVKDAVVDGAKDVRDDVKDTAEEVKDAIKD